MATGGGPSAGAGSPAPAGGGFAGAVIGEFISSNEGLGNLLLVANSQVNTPLAFASLLALAVLGMVLYAAVAFIDIALKPWFSEVRH